MRTSEAKQSSWIIFIIIQIFIYNNSSAQELDKTILGWYGDEVIPESDFIDVNKWITNAQAGNSITLVSNDSSLQLNWKISSGNHRWVQTYMVFNPAISINRFNIFALDIMGSQCQSGNSCHQEVSLEFKFENGPRHAVFERRGEPGLLGIDRWVERLFFLRHSENFYIPDDFNWDSITVFSIAVLSYPDSKIIDSDSGYVSFRNFIADNTDTWSRATLPEELSVSEDTLSSIKNSAAAFILGRQTSQGLLTTWEEDNSSWLYGQGLALKILVMEGTWENDIPTNDYAMAAKNLAYFLADNQYSDGSWPRAWNSNTGSIIVPYEADGTIWMGDFPFPLMGLEAYLKKVCDTNIAMARDKAREFLLSLIEPEGKLYTINKISGARTEVTSTEAYVAAIASLIETGDSVYANALINYVVNQTWNNKFKSWDEGFYSDRVVLFANTWMANLFLNRGYSQQSMDALSFVGKLLFTRGPGTPYGFDGIGPIATWYEGTLSYINAKGPGSNFLFRNIIPHINPDGSVPHYNDDIGANAGIWAEPWASLDGSSWLYFTASGTSPFHPLLTTTDCDPVSSEITEFKVSEILIFPIPASNTLHIKFSSPPNEKLLITIKDAAGRTMLIDEIMVSGDTISLDISKLKAGIYFIEFTSGKSHITRRILI
jgi:hypothetical protein